MKKLRKSRVVPPPQPVITVQGFMPDELRLLTLLYLVGRDALLSLAKSGTPTVDGTTLLAADALCRMVGPTLGEGLDVKMAALCEGVLTGARDAR